MLSREDLAVDRMIERHATKGPLHEHQRDWLDSYFDSPKRITFLKDGIGKTTFGVGLIFTQLILHPYCPQFLIMCRRQERAIELGEMVAAFIEDSDKWLSEQFGVDHVKSPFTFRRKTEFGLTNGGRLILSNDNPLHLRGRSLTGIFLDFNGFNLEDKKDLELYTCLAPCVFTYGKLMVSV